MRASLIGETLLVLSAIVYGVWYLANKTNILGPYGSASDVYHEVILISTLFITFMIFEIFIHGRFRDLEIA